MADTPAQAALRAAFDSKLSVIPQTLSSSQQTQARTNIGALGETEKAVSATMADRFSANRSISLTGAITGSASSNFSGNVGIATTYTVMDGATASAAGAAGAVPAPAAGENDEFLRGDGTWQPVPNNAVLQTASSSNGNYPILLKETTGTSTTTDGAIFDANVYVNPSTGVLTANGFVGNLTGNASTASEWATARTITLSGDATGSVSIDGSANATLNLTIANSSVTNAMLAASSVTFAKVNSGDVATQAEAEAGTANNSFMTPLRVAQAIAAHGASADAYVVETYHSDTSWYRVWSDGFVEQGGFSNSPYGQIITVTLIKPLTTTNYTILLGGVGGRESSVRVQPDNQTTTSFQTRRYYSGSGQGSGSLYWEALGY